MASKEMQALAKKMLATRQGSKTKPAASKKPLAKAPATKKVAKEAKKMAPTKKALPKKAMKESSAAAVSSADALLKKEVEKFTPKKKAPSVKAPADKYGAKRTALMSEMESAAPFKALERDLPKGGAKTAIKSAEKELGKDVATAAGAALKKKSTLKSLGKAAGLAGAVGGIALSLMSDDPASAVDPFNSESAGDKDLEAMELAESNQAKKTKALIASRKASASDSVSTKAAATKKAPKIVAKPGKSMAPAAKPGSARINGKDYKKEGPMDGMYDAPITQMPTVRGKSDEQKAKEFHGHLEREFGAQEGDGDLEKLVRETTMQEMENKGFKRTSPKQFPKKPVTLKTGKSFSQIHKEANEEDDGY